MAKTKRVTSLDYTGQVGYIVGSGPTIMFLKAEHFTSPGPVIFVNEAVKVAHKFKDCGRDLYGMRKDGCWTPHDPETGAYLPKTEWPCPKDCKTMTEESTGVAMWVPHDVRAIVSEAESKGCMPEHPHRYIIDVAKDLDMEWCTLSLVTAIQIALKAWGCTHVVLAGCDALSGIYDSYAGNESADTPRLHKEEGWRVKKWLRTSKVSYETFTPPPIEGFKNKLSIASKGGEPLETPETPLQAAPEATGGNGEAKPLPDPAKMGKLRSQAATMAIQKVLAQFNCYLEPYQLPDGRMSIQCVAHVLSPKDRDRYVAQAQAQAAPPIVVPEKKLIVAR